VKPEIPDNENARNPLNNGDCSLCRDLLVNLERFFEALDAARKRHDPDWLTVEEVAHEMKISKSIIYRLIRNGDLEAVDLVVTDEGKIPRKGHFRIRRSALDQYVEARKVKPPPDEPTRSPARRFPKVKNRLGL
jgi:hypothetical protein